MPGHVERTASTVRRATPRSTVMLPSSSRRWIWMTAAPASWAALASAAISATVPGIPGLSAFVATGPVSAAVMMGFGIVGLLGGRLRRGCRVGRSLLGRERGDQVVGEPRVGGCGRLLGPGQEALPGLHAELARGDLVAQDLQRTGRTVDERQDLLVDVEDEVEAAEIGGLERAHHREPQPEAVLDAEVDRF